MKFYFSQEAFRALHSNIPLVQKYLKTFCIGDVIEDENEDDNVCSTDDQELKNDFELLRQKAISKVYFYL